MPRFRSTGKMTLLRCHEVGTGYGPDSDHIDVEVVVQLDSRPNEAYGFTLRDDDRLPSHQGMLDLLRDAFNEGWTTTLVYDLPDGKRHGLLVRAWVTQPVEPSFDFDSIDADAGVVAPPILPAIGRTAASEP